MTKKREEQQRRGIPALLLRYTTLQYTILYHKLISFADIAPRAIVIAPCDESSVLLCKSSLKKTTACFSLEIIQ